MSKRQQNKEERLNRIISQAEILFLKDGFERVQMQDIADAAEIGVATLFRYFPKKDQLIVAAAVRNLAPTLDAFKELTSRTGDAYSRLEAIIDYLLDQQMKRTSHSRFREAFESYASFVVSPLPGIDNYIGLQREIMETLEPLIEHGKTDGSLRGDIDVKTTVVTIINAFGTFGNNIILKSHISYLEDDIEPHIQQRVLREMLLSYVRS
ncbi:MULTISPECIES: TetR/AcrR family transcriptional regulator [unclassified Exiguobacterium]|uniref:TetR/AcrR family transcriptional regulator n=1 Tax=unclassified Exiguobacterium TaxID=2644629 RepID=UPI001BEBF5C4|nr:MULTISPECIES: TetR/AcrR family transcriptional regulator [unclassified Exiguobacterium]